MPIFDYICPNPECQHTFDELAKSSDTVVECPKCTTVSKRQISAPSFILKGSGFYSSGTFTNSKQGPKRDAEFDRLSDREQNIELGLPEDCGL